MMWHTSRCLQTTVNLGVHDKYIHGPARTPTGFKEL